MQASKHMSMSAFAARVVDVRESCRLSLLAYSELKSIAPKPGRMIGAYDGSKNCSLPLLACKDAQAFMTLRRPHVGDDDDDDGRREELVVSFRGTINRRDLMDAIDIRHANFPYGKAGGCVHRGFLDQFASIEPMITRDIANVVKKRRIRRVCFTGHSMGAALALMAAKRYGAVGDVTNNVMVACHAFGGPPFADAVFWRGFVDDVDNHLAINLRDDVVPVIPVHTAFSSSPPDTIELTHDGIARCIMDTYAPPKTSRLVNRAARCGSVASIVANHEASAYLHSIDRLLERISGYMQSH